MQYLKLWSSESGSAAAEFVMVVIPTTVLLLPLFGLLGLMQAKLVNGQLAYEVARYAALADVTDTEADAHLGTISDKAKLNFTTNDGFCQANVRITNQIAIFAYPELIPVTAIGKARCEIQ